jgi:hypothetical protein
MGKKLQRIKASHKEIHCATRNVIEIFSKTHSYGKLIRTSALYKAGNPQQVWTSR